MQRYLFLRALAPTAILLYALLALGMTNARSGTEFYPFFNWSLFSNASAIKKDVVVIVRSVNGQVLAEPKLFYDLPNVFYSARTGDSRFGKALNRLNHSVLAGDQQTEAALRAVIEVTFMREARQMKYDLAVITYNPLDRYKSGRINNIQIIKSYDKTDAAK